MQNQTLRTYQNSNLIPPPCAHQFFDDWRGALWTDQDCFTIRRLEDGYCLRNLAWCSALDVEPLSYWNDARNWIHREDLAGFEDAISRALKLNQCVDTSARCKDDGINLQRHEFAIHPVRCEKCPRHCGLVVLHLMPRESWQE